MGYSHSHKVFQHQPDAVLNQANPVSGTKYEVLAETKNVRIIGIVVVCTWTVQPTPLEIHVTIDGQAIKHSQTDPESAKFYYPTINRQSFEQGQVMDVGAQQSNIPFLYEGRSIKVEAEITGGTVSNLSARVKYAKIP